jgi:hypothetical protein
MAVPPLIALQAAGKASKSLTGDILTRTTSKVVGKGKKAQVVDTTAHINPLTVGVGLAATAVGVGLAAWILQLKLAPQRVDTYRTVIDQAAYTESRPIPEVGHWADNVVVVGKMEPIWIGDTYIKGVLKLGHWITPDKVQTVPGQHWVVDVAQGVDKIPHAAVTHQELVGTKKVFSIEQRRGFSAGDVLEEVKDAVGLGEPIIHVPKTLWGKLTIPGYKWFG